MSHAFIRLRPRSEQIYISQGRIVIATSVDGSIEPEAELGLFVHETRMLSRHQVLVDGEPLKPVALSKVAEHAWLGYYITRAPGAGSDSKDMGAGLMDEASEQTLEARISRYVGSNMHEDLDLTNYSSGVVNFELAVELDADFADLVETARPRQQFGTLDRRFQQLDEQSWELRFDYRASHGDARLDRGLRLLVHRVDSAPRWERGRLIFDVGLEPQQRWHACLDYIPRVEEALTLGWEPSHYQCRSFEPTTNPMDERRLGFLGRASSIRTTNAVPLIRVVEGAFGQAVEDLATLRLHDLDVDETSWTMAAGLPLYVALFGRDTLTAAWQAAIVDTGMLKGTLTRLAERQGREVDDWRDEQPGRLLHEAHTGPLEVLGYNPRARYYGSITTSAFFPVALCELWHWSGDAELVRPFVKPALEALRWLDEWADFEGDGFYEYKTRSSQGTKHQAWKDSDSAMVYEDGTQAQPPIAASEEQGFAYMAKFMMAELLWWLGERELAARLSREAGELKRRFVDAFWMPDAGYLAMALDSDKRPLRSIGSNAGHCLATGIIDRSMAGPIAGRLLSDDMFSGWGVRTLSSEHPAYNPYSYHRGSVWPVENATFALGFMRYGLHGHVARLSRAMFEAAQLFESHRLPEVFSGHGRDADHPFPAFYPGANSPQAWSASAIFCFVQAMCGIYPYAPLEMLVVDPHLPEWLPELTFENLKVGRARTTIRFFRRADGTSDYRVEALEGPLHVLRQASPWSLTATPGGRLVDAFSSLLPRH
ncbi:MAG: amylo-alpha-1,6-glucosidase [Bradymonadaceae bacterium]|nr:amylo-alpha-1,6-glucosidase [Lujinxingiaceae bacterium]